ncbi:MFS transporter [Saccharopolyspora pogona]|uniref:MFS transporter n=1 Tax=Saccharopolyspora pogona TaxID=333966 RepID=UPI00168592BF|nr:MFS transporter [Saccharopolyspora pogona]
MRSTDPKPELPGRFVTPIALGTILQPLNSSMIAVALVGIRSHFDAGTSVTWLVSALYLATAVAAPAMGRIADVLGPRRTSLAGIVLVGATSAVAPFAPNVAALVVCRILIGIGTAAQYPCGVAMIRRAADRLRSRPNNALAALAICSQVTAALGPSLGGLLVGGFGWAGVFWINVPLALFGGAVIMRWGPADAPARGHSSGRLKALARVDPVGMLLFAVSITTLMFWLLSLATTPVWWWLAVAIPAVALTAWWGLRARDPFLDMRLLARGGLSLTYVRTIVTHIVLVCVRCSSGVARWAICGLPILLLQHTQPRDPFPHRTAWPHHQWLAGGHENSGPDDKPSYLGDGEGAASFQFGECFDYLRVCPNVFGRDRVCDAKCF